MLMRAFASHCMRAYARIRIVCAEMRAFASHARNARIRIACAKMRAFASHAQKCQHLRAFASHARKCAHLYRMRRNASICAHSHRMRGNASICAHSYRVRGNASICGNGRSSAVTVIVQWCNVMRLLWAQPWWSQDVTLCVRLFFVCVLLWSNTKRCAYIIQDQFDGHSAIIKWLLGQWGNLEEYG